MAKPIRSPRPRRTAPLLVLGSLGRTRGPAPSPPTVHQSRQCPCGPSGTVRSLCRSQLLAGVHLLRRGSRSLLSSQRGKPPRWVPCTQQPHSAVSSSHTAALSSDDQRSTFTGRKTEAPKGKAAFPGPLPPSGRSSYQWDSGGPRPGLASPWPFQRQDVYNNVTDSHHHTSRTPVTFLRGGHRFTCVYTAESPREPGETGVIVIPGFQVRKPRHGEGKACWKS